MTNIRKGVFETNSSSVHSICIPNNPSVSKPDFIKLSHGVFNESFGWEFKTLSSVDDRVAYFCEMLYYAELKYVNAFKNYLDRNNIKCDCDFDKFFNDTKCLDYETTMYLNCFGIDHGYHWYRYIDNFFDNDCKLLTDFLFGDGSEVRLGNDNDTECFGDYVNKIGNLKNKGYIIFTKLN